MAKLGVLEEKFCEKSKIPKGRLFDASGLKPAEYHQVMGAAEKWAAYGVTPCRRENHVLRNRHGTCLMCDEKAVAYLLRTKMAGYLYVASGASGDLMKLGFSNDPANRLKILNYEGWGGYSDWTLRAFGWAQYAGRLESVLQGKFSETCVHLDWERNWRSTATRESFHADITSAILELADLCDAPPEIVPPPWH